MFRGGEPSTRFVPPHPSVRANLEASSYGSMVYVKTTPEGGWTGPTLVAASETAGHQLSPDLAIDANDGLHLAWQDQRSVTEEQRVADASNADVFISDHSDEHLYGPVRDWLLAR